MSVEEEVELKDLVAQTLESNGCLPKIRAQLRANLFLALEEDLKVSKQQPMLDKKIKSCLEVPEGQLMFSLVQEFLEYFNLDFTASVYGPETYLENFYKYEGRQKIIEDLGLSTDDFPGPVLLHIVKIAQLQSKTLKINLTNINNGNENSETMVNSVCNKFIESSTSVSEDSLHKKDEKKLNHENEADEKKILNATFIKKDENDDTYNGTSSIEEESFNENGKDHSMSNEPTKSEQGSSPDSKSKSDEKVKISSKSDKLKSKLELPPLQLNKSLGSGLLPSLYSKEFKEKTNKDYDFEIKDDYEEDFMSGSELDFSQSKVESPRPLFEELQQCSEFVGDRKKSWCSDTNGSAGSADRNSSVDENLTNSNNT